MENFSERLIHLRHIHNLTQKEVSDSLELVYTNYINKSKPWICYRAKRLRFLFKEFIHK